VSAPQPVHDLPADVTAALTAGRKIEAIRLYRRHAGCDLKQAKQAVEAVQAQVRAAHPHLAPGEVPRRGSAWPWITMAIGLGIVFWFARR
jgi:hypothetical protein